ncbi:hypothetical protein BDR03DRAFT_984847 [Suillus americanus]|nr:hypothetical protein BDR03DRAFT_984847 [Suillus americanus]
MSDSGLNLISLSSNSALDSADKGIQRPVAPPSSGASIEHYQELIKYIQLQHGQLQKWNASLNDSNGILAAQQLKYSNQNLLRTLSQLLTLYPDHIINEKTIFTNWIVIAKIIKVAVCGKMSLYSKAHSSPPSYTKIWKFTSCTPGLIAFSIILMVKKFFIMKWTHQHIKSVVEQINGSMTISTSQPMLTIDALQLEVAAPGPIIQDDASLQPSISTPCLLTPMAPCAETSVDAQDQSEGVLPAIGLTTIAKPQAKTSRGRRKPKSSNNVTAICRSSHHTAA